MAYSNGLFVAVASSGNTGNRVMSSPDGITWTSWGNFQSLTPGVDSNWYGVAYGNGFFVAVGYGPVLTMSPSSSSSSSSNGFSDAETIGVAVGCAAGIQVLAFGIAALVYFLCFKPKSATESPDATSGGHSAPAQQSSFVELNLERKEPAQIEA